LYLRSSSLAKLVLRISISSFFSQRCVDFCSREKKEGNAQNRGHETREGKRARRPVVILGRRRRIKRRIDDEKTEALRRDDDKDDDENDEQQHSVFNVAVL
jgi:hypothetical protein